MEYWIWTITWGTLGYLLGSLPFGLIWSKILKKGDPRTMGSGNIGATNVYRLAGLKVAALVYLSDFLKGALPVFFAPQGYKMPTGIACVLGHIFSIFLKLQGGKGVATACGVVALLFPLHFFVAMAVWWVCLKISGYVSLASLVGIFSILWMTFFFSSTQDTLGMAIISALIVYTHRSNILRLIQGKENSLGRRK